MTAGASLSHAHSEITRNCRRRRCDRMYAPETTDKPKRNFFWGCSI